MWRYDSRTNEFGCCFAHCVDRDSNRRPLHHYATLRHPPTRITRHPIEPPPPPLALRPAPSAVVYSSNPAGSDALIHECNRRCEMIQFLLFCQCWQLFYIFQWITGTICARLRRFCALLFRDMCAVFCFSDIFNRVCFVLYVNEIVCWKYRGDGFVAV